MAPSPLWIRQWSGLRAKLFCSHQRCTRKGSIGFKVGGQGLAVGFFSISIYTYLYRYILVYFVTYSVTRN